MPLLLKNSNKDCCRHKCTCKHCAVHSRPLSDHTGSSSNYSDYNSSNATHSGRCSVSHNNWGDIGYRMSDRDDCIHFSVLVAKIGIPVYSVQPKLDHVIHSSQMDVTCHNPLQIHILNYHHLLSWTPHCNS